jgi:SAM-dependent methyltransferase
MSVFNACERFWDSIRLRGPWGSAKRIVRRLQEARLERSLGVQTQGSIHAEMLGSTGMRFGYQPIDYHSFATAMTRIDVSPDDVFADYGCGMGRAVVLAARYPVRRVFGIELSSELVEIARNNVRRAMPKLRVNDVEIIQADATDFVTPDDLSLLFMYNPFAADVLDAAMERVRESLERRPRRLQVIYALPKMDRDALQATDWLRRVRDVQTDNAIWERITIYENCMWDEASKGSHDAESEHTCSVAGAAG